MPDLVHTEDMSATHSNTVSDLYLAASRSNDPYWAKKLEKMAKDLQEALDYSENLRCA
jgi:hypothetical protein